MSSKTIDLLNWTGYDIRCLALLTASAWANDFLKGPAGARVMKRLAKIAERTADDPDEGVRDKIRDKMREKGFAVAEQLFSVSKLDRAGAIAVAKAARRMVNESSGDFAQLLPALEKLEARLAANIGAKAKDAVWLKRAEDTRFVAWLHEDIYGVPATDKVVEVSKGLPRGTIARWRMKRPQLFPVGWPDDRSRS